MKAFLKRCGRLLPLFYLLSLWVNPDRVFAEGKSQTRTKATFLYYLSKFVVWPEERFSGSKPSTKLCILGIDPFGSDLDLVVQRRNKREDFSDKSIRLGQNIIIRRLVKIEDRNDCHILFISASERNQFGLILAELKGSSVLTVGNQEAFIQAGGMVNFALHEEKLRLEINLPAAEAAGLKISSKLLRLAIGSLGPSKREEDP